MSWLRGIDISQWQGNINWDQVKTSGIDFAMIKMSGGDAGLYYDSKAAFNYANAKPRIPGVGGYHFAGATDPVAEAEKFFAAMSPLAENDVCMLDWEVPHPNPPAWCDAFIDHLASKGISGGILYMNLATLNAYDWSSPLSKWGLCLADWAVSPDADAPTKHIYVMQQYTDAGTVPGISGRVDLDAFFGTIEQFNKYGYHAPQPSPTPQPAPTPAPAPAPEPQPSPAPTPDPTPEPSPTPDPVPPQPEPSPAPSPDPQPIPAPQPKPSLFDWLKALLKKITDWLSKWRSN